MNINYWVRHVPYIIDKPPIPNNPKLIHVGGIGQPCVMAMWSWSQLKYDHPNVIYISESQKHYFEINYTLIIKRN